MGEDKLAILEALKAGEFLLSVHAAERMTQRGITKNDIRECGRTVASFRYQPEQGTFRVDGRDLDGELLTVICARCDEVIIVTIF